MIKVHRKKNWSDSFRNYEVYVDNVFLATVKDDETIELDVENGEHTIFVKIDWCRSKTLTFTKKENEVLEFECTNYVKNIIDVLLGTLYITIFRKKFIKLKQIEVK